MVFLIFFFNLWAQEVVIQSEKTSNLEYEKYMLENPNKKSFVQDKKSQKDTWARKLEETLMSAQFEFLNGNLELAKANFKKITEMQHEGDWDKNDQETVHFAFLRQAQLEPTESKQRALIQQALIFNVDTIVDSKFFPPPFVSLYNQMKAQMKDHIWQLPKNADAYDIILINGKNHKGRTGFLKTVDGVQRFSFLSNRYAPVHYISAPAHLAKVSIPLEPLATGSCDHPQLSPSIEDKNRYLYLVHDCVGNFNKDLAPSPTLAQSLPPPTPSVQTSSMKLFKSKWFWIGASVVATGLVVNHLSQQHNSSPSAQPEPVKTFSNH